MRSLLLTAVLLAAQTAACAQPAAQTLYLEYCSACHKPTGLGVKGAFPALVGDPTLQGDGAQAVATVLNGRGGMPTFKADLTDAQIADILTYVRSAWGNKGQPITAADVAAARSKGPQSPPPRGLQAH